MHDFTRRGDHAAQALAQQLGACWAGGSDMTPPQPLDAALLFAPVGAQVPKALQVHTVACPLQEADRALDDLRAARVAGAAVLQC